MSHSFVSDDYVIPLGLAGPGFCLDRSDPSTTTPTTAPGCRALSTSGRPGFFNLAMPPADGMSLDENLRDLQRHADDFKQRVGFTYTVVDDEDGVVGCVYIYPSRADPDITEVRSWVTANRADLDPVLHETVDSWLAADWPFTDVRYRSGV